jgi:tripartite-type tricarboxylate transporter receptor subunit TctC
MHRIWMISATAFLLSLGAAHAQEWPAQPITPVVPFAAGGGIDVSVRIQAQHMSETLGQTIVTCEIDRPG